MVFYNQAALDEVRMRTYSLSLSLSLSLSHTHTHTHRHTHTLSLSHTHTHTHTLSLTGLGSVLRPRPLLPLPLLSALGMTRNLGCLIIVNAPYPESQDHSCSTPPAGLLRPPCPSSCVGTGMSSAPQADPGWAQWS